MKIIMIKKRKIHKENNFKSASSQFNDSLSTSETKMPPNKINISRKYEELLC